MSDNAREKKAEGRAANFKGAVGNRFGKDNPAIAGPGRPRLAADVIEARQILKDAAPAMAARIAELSNHHDPDIAIKAIKVGLDKILPNLEEVENFEHRPLQQFTDEQLEHKLSELRSGTSGHHSGNGAAA
jgi:hypothetical protein